MPRRNKLRSSSPLCWCSRRRAFPSTAVFRQNRQWETNGASRLSLTISFSIEFTNRTCTKSDGESTITPSCQISSRRPRFQTTGQNVWQGWSCLSEVLSALSLQGATFLLCRKHFQKLFLHSSDFVFSSKNKGSLAESVCPNPAWYMHCSNSILNAKCFSAHTFLCWNAFCLEEIWARYQQSSILLQRFEIYSAGDS